MNPKRLSYQLRNETSDDLARRRWVLGLSLVGAAAGGVVSLYQMGLVKRLPDLPFPPFDATKVDKSPYAYKRFDTPDAPLMLLSYAATAVLASAGGKHRADTHPALPIALAAKTVTDAAVALKLGQEEWAENKALCGYCQAATLASIASVALAVPEAIKALRNLFAGGRQASYGGCRPRAGAG